MVFTVKQEELVEDLLERHIINSIDDRGYYIVMGGSGGGFDYLYHDGIIRTGVNTHLPHGFWPTEKDAWEFYFKWALANG